MSVRVAVLKSKAGECAAWLLRIPLRTRAWILRKIAGEPLLRIGLVTFGWTPLTGGIGNYLVSLIRGWAEEIPAHPLRIYATKGAFDHFRRMFPLAGRLEMKCLMSPEQVREKNADFDVYVQIGHFEPSPPPRSRCVYYLADLQERFFPEFFTEAERARRTSIHQDGLRYAQRIMTGATFCARSFEELLGFPEGRTSVMPLPVGDLPARPARPDNWTASIKDFIYFPADDYVHKNHERLFQAIAMVRQRGRPVDLVCTGGRFSGRNLSAMAAEAGLEGHFFDLGKVSRENVAWLFRNSRLLAFPTLFEGFGLPVVEAFLSRTPVVCSGVTSLVELAGDAAVICNPFDAEHMASCILQALSDNALRERCITTGQKRMKQFALPTMIRAHYELFREVSQEPMRSQAENLAGLPPFDTRRAWSFYRETAHPSIAALLPEERPVFTAS